MSGQKFFKSRCWTNGPDEQASKKHANCAMFHQMMADYYTLSSADQTMFLTVFFALVENRKAQEQT